ncbi:hypothetical protein HanRHA438_Chr16g0763431 [Helianthus annuus]|nr:hypothetical protein HanIR_Chr16g0816691 [Helianthus annuus]KAJ0641090.1 hypothetical protein HanLR1_Chr16g0623201 [Helianthus annuus]KAJ0645011.1 hypothetical protein HanOQP8_Chr16g0618961 [Helianthus annuus]KAJ0836136.1 hypothetical protein HanRHA438_Chr16g0763431 [Helianthus annuus]
MNKNQTRESSNVPWNDKGKSPQVVEPSSVQESYDLGIGTSFKETLTKNIINNIDLIELAPNINAFSQWHDKGIVGRVIDFTKLINLRGWLHGKDLKKVQIKYIGGTSVLLIFDTVDSANSFVGNDILWKECFRIVDVWKGQMLAYERIAWIKIYGVPWNLAINPVFNAIGGRLWNVVQPADVSEDDDDLSFVCVGILSSEGSRIKKAMSLKWQDKTIRVWIEEEPREWVPDFLEEDSEDGSQIRSECNMEEERVDDLNPKKSDDVSEPEKESDIDMVNQVTHANLDSIDDTNHVHIEGGNNLVSNDEENISHNVESQTNDRFENSLGNDNCLDNNNNKSNFFKIFIPEY